MNRNFFNTEIDLKHLNGIFRIWFVYRIIRFFFFKVLVKGFNNIQVCVAYDIEIDVSFKNIYPLIFFLKKHTLCQCKSIIDIICYDGLNKKYRFAIIYNILSVYTNFRVKVISKVYEYCSLLSLVGLYQSVNWYEREVFDFFGVFFIWNNDLRRILSDYGFKGYALRKDFPITGYVDVYYNDNQKRICYKKLELAQEYRNFNLNTGLNLMDSGWDDHQLTEEERLSMERVSVVKK